ncbi:MAG: hypothetical protein ACREIR_09635, partial [Geminicoccaceae bacterium]
GLRGAIGDWRAARAARPPKPPGPGLRERFRSWREQLREQSKPLPKGQGYSLDFLAGKGVRSFGEAIDVSATTRLNVRIASLAAEGTPEALEALTRLTRERGTHEARRLLRRLQGVEPGLPPGPAAGAPATITQRATYARGITGADDAYAVYNEALMRAGGREVGIYQSLDTGEFAVRVGDFGSVDPPWDGQWAHIAHFHPNPENVLTYRLPSPQDFSGPMQRFMATRRAVRGVVEFDVPGVGRGRTEFGLEPGPEPLYVKIQQPDGRSVTLRFADDEAYRAYWSSRKVYAEPGSQGYEDLISGTDSWLAQQRGHMPDLPSGGQTMTGIGPRGGPPSALGQGLDAVIDDLLVHGPPPGRPSPQQLAGARARLDAGAATVADIEVLLRDAIADARAMLRNVDDPVLSWQAVNGACGTGRDCSAAAFAALGANTPHPITIYRFQAVDVFEHGQQHGFSVVVLPNGDRYLVDATFGQFMRPRGVPYEVTPRGGALVPELGASGEVLRDLPGGPALAEKLLRDGFVRLDDTTAPLYAQGLGVADPDAARLGGRLMGDHSDLLDQAAMVDTYGSGPPQSVVLQPGPNVPEWSRSEIIAQASAWIVTLRRRGDPSNLIPELERVVRRLGGNVP